MRPLPLNLLTLYADLDQSSTQQAASISRRREGGKIRVYASIKAGATRRQTYIGTEGEPKTDAAAAAYRRAAAEARLRRRTVSLLKRGGVPAPDIQTGRLLEALAEAGLFERGVVLIGTVAFQLYSPIVGATLASSALMTQDADFALTRLAAPKFVGEDFGAVLKRADPTFEPVFRNEDRLPKQFRSTRGFSVDIVTAKGRSPNVLQVKGLNCAATPLRFLDFLLEDTMTALALYGAGVRVRLPDPARFAVHKLILAQARPKYDAKARKDILQARELIAALQARDPSSVDDAIELAKARGPQWRAKLARGLEMASSAPIPDLQ